MPDERSYRSETYFEFSEMQSRGPEMRAWMDWFQALGIPPQQVDHEGWVVRDPYRNTVSVKTILWKPDGPQPDMVDRNASTICYPDYASRGMQYGVMTVECDGTPPAFPEPYFTKEDAELQARRSLASLWSKLAQVGDISENDRPKVAELQPHIERIRHLLDQIDAQRGDDDGLRVGVTYGRQTMESD